MTEQKTPPSDQNNSAQRKKQQRQLLNSRMAAAQFGNIVTVLMQSPGHRDARLSDLYRTVVPPLLANQFKLAEAVQKGSGTALPVGVILWARVSDEMHQKLCKQPEQPIILEPKDWNGGNNYWIVDAVGPQRFVAPLLSGLRQQEFKGKTVHYRAKSQAGAEVRTLAATHDGASNEVQTPAGGATAATDGLNGKHAAS